MNDEIVFLKKFFLLLEQSKIKYCVLRNTDELLRGDAHDIDMVIESRYFSKIPEILKTITESDWKIHFDTKKDNGNLRTIHLYKIVDRVPVLLHFDFFETYGWKGLKLIYNNQLLTGTQRKEWIYEASPSIQAVTMLFSRFLYQGYINEKYRCNIQSIFKDDSTEVSNIMSSFLPKNIVNGIIEDVWNGDWNNIEQEYPVITRGIIEIINKQHKHIKRNRLVFSIERLKKYTGIVVCINNSANQSNFRSYISQVGQLLSRTFSSNDIVVMDKDMSVRGGGYRDFISIKLKMRIGISKGQLIFTSNKAFGKSALIIDDIKSTSPTVTATRILETMSKRY